jgi:hypothetical protein
MNTYIEDVILFDKRIDSSVSVSSKEQFRLGSNGNENLIDIRPFLFQMGLFIEDAETLTSLLNKTKKQSVLLDGDVQRLKEFVQFFTYKDQGKSVAQEILHKVYLLVKFNDEFMALPEDAVTIKQKKLQEKQDELMALPEDVVTTKQKELQEELDELMALPEVVTTKQKKLQEKLKKLMALTKNEVTPEQKELQEKVKELNYVRWVKLDEELKKIFALEKIQRFPKEDGNDLFGWGYFLLRAFLFDKETTLPETFNLEYEMVFWQWHMKQQFTNTPFLRRIYWKLGNNKIVAVEISKRPFAFSKITDETKKHLIQRLKTFYEETKLIFGRRLTLLDVFEFFGQLFLRIPARVYSAENLMMYEVEELQRQEGMENIILTKKPRGLVETIRKGKAMLLKERFEEIRSFEQKANYAFLESLE